MNEGQNPDIDESIANRQPLAQTTNDQRMLSSIKSWANKIRDPDSANGRFAAKAGSLTKPVAELLGDLAKIFGLCSVLGVMVVIIYLHSSDVPLPPIQIGDIATFAVPTFVLTACAVSFISALGGIPFAIKKSHQAYIAGATGSIFREKLRAHFWCYGPWLGVAPAFVAFLIWATTVASWTAWALFIAVYYGFFLHRLKNRVRMPSPLEVCLDSVFLALWFSLIYSMLSNILSGLPGVPDWAYLVVAFLLVALLSFMLWPRDKPAPSISGGMSSPPKRSKRFLPGNYKIRRTPCQAICSA